MKFFYFFAIVFAIICATFAADCPAGLKDIEGTCGISRPINGECPKGTKYSVAKGFCTKA